MRPTPRLLIYTYSTQRGSCAVWSLSVFVTGVSSTKMPEPIEMRFGGADSRESKEPLSGWGSRSLAGRDVYDRVMPMCLHFVDSRLQSSLPLVATNTP